MRGKDSFVDVAVTSEITTVKVEKGKVHGYSALVEPYCSVASLVANFDIPIIPAVEHVVVADGMIDAVS